jgi:8-oxo-dGTP diphosphatase
MKKEYTNPASTVDLIVMSDQGIVLIKRKNEPFKGYWALPGGFLENGKETLEQAASRELFEETNLKTNPERLRLIGVYSNPRRDPRGHVISHTYEVRNYSGNLKAKDDAAEINFFKNLPDNLAFDHKKILNDYFKMAFFLWGGINF